MKKLFALLAALAAVLTCSGCSTTAVYAREDRVFSAAGMEITLTEGFRSSDYEGYAACYDSAEAAVFVIKEEFSLLEGLADMSLADYAALVLEANSAKASGGITQVEGLTCIEYTFFIEDMNENYSYLTVMYKGDNAFWVVQFSCAESLYATYRPYFVKWAGTVDVSSAD